MADIAALRSLAHRMQEQQRWLSVLTDKYPSVTPEILAFVQWFETAFDLCPLPIWAKDAQGRRIAQNQAYAALYGKDKARGLGKVDEGWEQETKNDFTANDARALASGYVIVDEPIKNQLTNRVEHLHVPKWRVTLNDGTVVVMGCVAGHMPAPILEGMGNVGS